jgi:hypothetical protein
MLFTRQIEDRRSYDNALAETLAHVCPTKVANVQPPAVFGLSPRHVQQDLAATEEVLHRVLDVVEGVHARHGDDEVAVGY